MIDAAHQVLGYLFRDEALLRAALTHASSADHRLQSNERLEFLGDAILGYVVCEELFRAYPDRLEGCLLYTSPSPRDLSTSRMPSSA